MPKSKAVKAIKLPGSHRLLKDSLGFGKRNWQAFGGIVLVGVVISFLIRFFLTPDTAVLYQSVWFVFYASTLFWTIQRIDSKQSIPSWRAAFYDGTASALRLFLVLLIVALASIPFSIGGFVFSLTVSLSAANAGLVEQAIFGLIWFLFSLVTLLFLARIALSMVVVTTTPETPWRAIRQSWRLSRGYTNNLLWRLLIPGLYTVVVVALVTLALASIRLDETINQIVVETLAAGVLLPLFFVYLYKIYQLLK
jgi:hypothetical protein